MAAGSRSSPCGPSTCNPERTDFQHERSCSLQSQSVLSPLAPSASILSFVHGSACRLSAGEVLLLAVPGRFKSNCPAAPQNPSVGRCTKGPTPCGSQPPCPETYRLSARTVLLLAVPSRFKSKCPACASSSIRGQVQEGTHTLWIPAALP